MDFMNNIGEYQTKERQDNVRTLQNNISPEKYDSSREERISSLSEGEWPVAESQRGMT